MGDGSGLDPLRAFRLASDQSRGDHRFDRDRTRRPSRSRKRWLVAWPYLILYILVGLAAASFVTVLGSLPKPLITAIAGLALFAPLLGSATAMFKEREQIEAALAAFLVAASGITFHGVGAPFLGLVLGLVLHGARHIHFTRQSNGN
jgi:predicted benzoate:H+ symporter BenE